MSNTTHLIERALLCKKVISKEQLIRAKKVQKTEAIGLEESLIKLGYSTYPEIIECLAEQYDLQIIDVNNAEISEEMINLLPMELIKKHNIVPVSKSNGVVTIAMSSPPDLGFMDNLRFMLGADVSGVLDSPENIRNVIRKYFDQESTEAVDTLLRELRTGDKQLSQAEIEKIETSYKEKHKSEDDSPVIQLVSLFINKAISAHASDVHIEPLSNKLRIRYRIDGVCQEADVLPKNLQDSIISRIKILANIDISEKRRPQDGRISLKYAGRELDVRISCLPSIYGESVVMRLLEKSETLMSLKNLGFYDEDFKRFHSIIKRPNGILLITGPTGSGKTTTLYATLKELNKIDTNIVTVEDPVEYTIHGVNQSEVNEKIGFSFPTILRTILRQDPNIILVGEIRDTDTADIAIAAALTGHFVMSTLHTNDAPSAITRLIDMGVKPFLVSTSLQGIMAQRLVRINCEHCKEPILYSPEQILRMGFDVNSLSNCTFYKGNGCKKCNNTGYQGRMGIYELLDMNENLRDMTYREASTDEIRKTARAMGMKTLKEDGFKKARDGKTTLEEIFRVTGVEG